MSFPAATLSYPALQTWQWWFQGVTLGPGTNYGLKKVEGLSLPHIRSGDSGRARDHGEFIGLDLSAARDVTLTLDIGPSDAPTGPTFAEAFNTLANVMLPGAMTETPLYFGHPTRGLVAFMTRSRKMPVNLDITVALGGMAQNVPIQFHCTDPRMYSVPTSLNTCGLPNFSGLTFPLTFPLSFGGAIGNYTIIAMNSGNFDCRPLLTITGPCLNPRVTLTTVSGQPSVGFNVGLNTGDTLVVDMDSHSVLLTSFGSASSASRASSLAPGSTWWSLQPGENVVEFSQSSGADTAGTLAMQWASAWLA